MKNSIIKQGCLFRDGLLSPTRAQEIAKPLFPKLLFCISAGLKAQAQILRDTPRVFAELKSRTLAGIAHDHMESMAQRIFSDEPNVKLIPPSEHGFLMLDIQGELIVRFKKLSSDLHPYNVRTGRQLAYAEQTLYGPAATLATTGYRLDAAGLLRDAHIVCWEGSRFHWSIRLPDKCEEVRVVHDDRVSLPQEPDITPRIRESLYKQRSS